MTIRLLNINDAKQYFILQSKSSILSENSFYNSEGESASLKTIQKVLNNLSNVSFRLGAFVDEKLIGLICLNRKQLIKIKHKAEIFGFFVYPEYQKKGIGNALLSETLKLANKIEGLEAITLSVFSESKSAIKLYKEYGFEKIGIESKSIKTKSGYIDEIFMRLDLTY